MSQITEKLPASQLAGATISPQVSIVVTAYNNADTIAEAIASLGSQSYTRKHLLVVVDQSSSDETEVVVDKECALLEGCSVIKCRGVGRSKARNIGWMHASSPVVMFADGDDVYDHQYLAKAVGALFANTAVGGVCLGGAPLPTGKKLLDDFYRAYGTADDRVKSGQQPEWAWVYKMECLKATGGFDENLSQAEDKDFCTRVKQAGFTIAYVPGVNWYRRKAQTFTKFISKEYLAGRRRVFYYAKKKVYRPIARGLAPAAVGAFLVGIGAIAGPIAASLATLLALLIFLIASAANAKGSFGSPRSIFRYSLMAVSARLAFCAGTLYGLSALLARTMGLTRIDSGRF